MLDSAIGRIHVDGDGKRVLIHGLRSFKSQFACEAELGIVPIRGSLFEFIIQRHKDKEVKTLGHVRTIGSMKVAKLQVDSPVDERIRHGQHGRLG